MKRKIGLLLLVVLVLAIPVTAYASGGQNGDGPGKVVMGGTYSLGPGETLDGDLVVMGGVAALAGGSTVQGNVAILGGALNANGTVQGDVVVVGGAVTFGDQAMVTGNLVTFGGAATRADGTQILGEEINGLVFTPETQLITPQVMTAPMFMRGFDGWQPSALAALSASAPAQAVMYILRALLMAGLALLVAVLIPRPTERAARTVAEAPWPSAGMGVLTAIVIPIVVFFLAITICLIPLAIIGVFVFVAAMVFGWVAVGLEVGRRLAKAFKWDLEPGPTAGLGTLVVSFIANGIGFIPCVGWVVPLAVGAVGLGAVVLSRFGRQDYPAEMEQLPVPAAQPPAKAARSKK